MRVAPVLLGMLFLLSGCQKILDYYKKDSASTKTSCRIAHYTYDFYDSRVDTYIDYDEKGNPVQITYVDEWLPEGQAKELFIYDELDRLVSHIPDEYLGNRREYFYEGDSRNPVRDSLYDSYGNKYVETFEFDYGGRITREEVEWVEAGEGFETEFAAARKETKRYYYDVHGNRQVNPFDHPWHKTLRYTNHRSLYSLHRTWQIIYRDFSRNNASRIKNVNEHDLPVTFIVDEFGYWQPFFDLAMNATITYDCR